MVSIPMKVDVYNCEERFRKWKEDALVEGVDNLTANNSSVLLQYALDMEAGRNIARSSRRGPRSYIRLNAIRHKMSKLLRLLQERGVTDVRAVTEQQVVELFSDFEKGVITTNKGEKFKSWQDYAVCFKAFWHWWMKVNRKNGVKLDDITEDLNSTRTDQPKFVYLTKEDVEKLMAHSSEDHQVLLLFLFDSMIRSPTEVLSLQARHVYERDGEVWITIPKEISKTFGRTFNLLYCGDALLNHIARHHLQSDDHLFVFSPPVMNRRLKELAGQIFGDRLSHPEGDPYKTLSLYDFRHSGAIHFRLLAKENPGSISLDAIRHRGGWSNFNMLDYYTRYIGLDGKIEKHGMLLKQDKHKLEQELEDLRLEFKKLRKMNAQILDAAQRGVTLGYHEA